MSINLINDAGVLMRVPTGFSWTSLFFLFFVPLLRRDIKWALVMLIVNFVTCGLSIFVFPFLYNKIYIKSLIADGYLPADDAATAYLKAAGLTAGE